MKNDSPKQTDFKLCDKDLEILNLRRSGLTLKEIARKVFLSKRAVEKRLMKLREQSGAPNDTALVNYCHDKGLFEKVA